MGERSTGGSVFQQYFTLKAEIEAKQEELKELEKECFMLAHQGVIPENVKYQPPKTVPPRKVINKDAVIQVLESFGLTNEEIDQKIYTMSKPGLRKPKLSIKVR